MQARTDPAEIVVRIGGLLRTVPDVRLALGAWVMSAQKAGWRVEVVSQASDDSAEERGRVVIEGLSYAIRYGQRVRHVLVDDSTGRAVMRPVFGYAAWAEPVIEERFP